MGTVKIGPPSGAGTCGTAAATYVPTSPNIRIEILTACFMGLLLPRPASRKSSSLTRRRIIRHESSPSAKFPHDRAVTPSRAELGIRSDKPVNTGQKRSFLRCFPYPQRARSPTSLKAMLRRRNIYEIRNCCASGEERKPRLNVELPRQLPSAWIRRAPPVQKCQCIHGYDGGASRRAVFWCFRGRRTLSARQSPVDHAFKHRDQGVRG